MMVTVAVLWLGKFTDNKKEIPWDTTDAEGDTAGNIWRSIGMKPAAFPGGLSLTLEAKD